MIYKNLPMLLISLFLSLLHIEAQSGSTIAVGPPLTCDLTTFTCPSITNGCCTIDGCCGTGCCALGYRCINEGTSNQACCSVYDPTLCGTNSSPPPDTGSGGGSGGGGDKTCTQIHNCRDSSTGQTWTCLLGQTCSLYYRGCYPCPYAGGSGGGGDNSSSSTDSPSDTSTSSPGTETPTGTSTATDTSTGTGAGAAVTITKAPSMGSRSGVSSIGNTWVPFLVCVFGYLDALA